MKMKNAANKSTRTQTNKISTFGKICRITLLWISSPLLIALRTTFKTLKKICEWTFYRPYLIWSKNKYQYAQAISEGKLKGLWYDKKWFIILRRCLSPIDWCIHLAISIVIAPFKFIKSFFTGFLALARITKDIGTTESNAYVYSHLNFQQDLTTIRKDKSGCINVKSSDIWNKDFDNQFPYLKPSIINRIGTLFLTQFNNLMEFIKPLCNWKCPITKYKPESTIPYVNTYYIPEKDKSFWIHVKAAIGINKIIPAYNKGNYTQEIKTSRNR